MVHPPPSITFEIPYTAIAVTIRATYVLSRNMGSLMERKITNDKSLWLVPFSLDFLGKKFQAQKATR